MTKRLIVGLVGNPGSGKSTIARHLANKHGFYHFEGSDYLRAEAKRRGVDLQTRNDYSEFHRSLQLEHGASVAAKYMLALPGERLVFSGLRSTQNARELQAAGGIIIALQAPVETRYARTTHDQLKSQPTLEEFKAVEDAQLVSRDRLGADVLSTMEIADITMNVARPLDEVLDEIDTIIEKLTTA
jgi:adenylate kinase family enzyme